MNKTAQDLAKKIASQMAQEPLEILKTAKEQTTGEKTSVPEHQTQTSSDQTKIIENQKKIQSEISANRRMEALNRELEDIRKQEIFKSLQRRIAEGEEVPLEDYPELSMEQREVLKAQMEAVKRQQLLAISDQSLVEPTAKKGRRFRAGQREEAEKQQTRVEKPVPPSG